jgi:RimJ/RimL family protein N-acetyltransferase
MMRIELRPFERNDFSRLIGWIRSPEFLMQWAGPIFRYPLDGAQLEAYIQGAEGDEPIRAIFKAVDIQTRAVMGHVELNNIDAADNSATVCRVLVGNPCLRRKGIGTQKVKQLLGIGFDQLMLHRIDLTVFEFNEGAIRCYEKLGFVREGRLREIRKVENEYRTLCLMSMLDREWRFLSAAKG